MLLRLAIAAAAMHGISPFMLSAGVGAGLPTPRCHSLVSYWTVLSATAECRPLNPPTWPTLPPPFTAPHGMEFLYSLNRLNVAMSRARCLALVVASPRLLKVSCRTPRQMRLANAVARLVEMAADPIGDQR